MAKSSSNQGKAPKRSISKTPKKASPATAATLRVSPSGTTQAGVIEFLRDPVLIIDSETLRILASNSAACELYRFERDEMLNMSILDLSPSPERPIARAK